MDVITETAQVSKWPWRHQSSDNKIGNSIVFRRDYDILTSNIAQLLTSRPFPDCLGSPFKFWPTLPSLVPQFWLSQCALLFLFLRGTCPKPCFPEICQSVLLAVFRSKTKCLPGAFDTVRNKTANTQQSKKTLRFTISRILHFWIHKVQSSYLLTT